MTKREFWTSLGASVGVVLLAALAIFPTVVEARQAAPVPVSKQGTLTTTAVTADQVVLTYTVTGNKRLYLTYVQVEATLTAPSATAALLGDCSVEFPSGTKNTINRFVNPTTSLPDRVSYLLNGEQSVVQGGAVVRVVCTPSSTTSTRWNANFGGIER